MISCCSKYMECSKEEFCINKYEDIKKSCRYRLKLLSGINFYNSSKFDGVPFIEYEDRLFTIGRRSSYGNYTYPLKKEEIEELFEIFKAADINHTDNIDFKKCKNDKSSDSNRACCLIILTIGRTKYNIHNFNNRTVTEDTAIKVRDYLRDKGFFVAIQYIGSKSNVLAQKENNKTNKKDKKEVEKEIIEKEKSEISGQLDMFQMGIL